MINQGRISLVFDVHHISIGREPSGVRFNALKVNKDGLPHNPLINSGAIMICSLIKRHLQSAERYVSYHLICALKINNLKDILELRGFESSSIL